jgi:hypothetical protein
VGDPATSAKPVAEHPCVRGPFARGGPGIADECERAPADFALSRAARRPRGGGGDGDIEFTSHQKFDQLRIVGEAGMDWLLRAHELMCKVSRFSLPMPLGMTMLHR